MSEQPPRAALFGTEARTLFSTIRGRDYHLSVALPDSYQTSTQAYPVIYVLDGDFNFGVAAGLTRFSNAFRNVPELIIVGMPRNMDGSYGPAALKVQVFVGALKDAIPIPVRAWDERLTSVQANKILRENKVRGDKRKQQVDKMAAAILLQSYLDSFSDGGGL